MGGGNGGCAASVLRLSGAWVVFPVPLFIVIGFDSVEYFPFVPGCVDSEWVCSLPSCVISTSSVSLVFVLRSCFRLLLQPVSLVRWRFPRLPRHHQVRAAGGSGRVPTHKTHPWGHGLALVGRLVVPLVPRAFCRCVLSRLGVS